jgi:ABC-type transporter Mla MlaB component
MPTPWVLDWTALRSIDAEAAARLTDLFRGWALQPLEMRWIGGDTLFHVLKEAAPAGVRDVDPALWRLRLESLRLANRPEQFDEAAIDYCVTYEVSPPSWEKSACKVRISVPASSPVPATVLSTGDATSSFAEATGDDSAAAHCELSGQLAGDITTLLHQVNGNLGAAQAVSVLCARLIRVDFIAAGDLLNWVLTRKAEGRHVTFIDANRLVALFFGAMGINEHARVQVRST